MINLPRFGDVRPAVATPAAPAAPRADAGPAQHGEARRDGALAGREQPAPSRDRRPPADRAAPDLGPLGDRRGGERDPLSLGPGSTPDSLPLDETLAAPAAALRLPGRPPLPLPDAALSERFHKALRRDDDRAEALPSPMSLFSALPPSAPMVTMAAIDPPPPPPALWQQIDRLLVADGSESRDSRRQVRLTLADRELRGTEVEVGEAGGELRVAFLCADIATRRRLAHHAPTMAAQLAERLGRAVQVVVGSPDRHDPERTECRQGGPS